MRTRKTWHWTDGPPPSPAIFKGLPVIESADPTRVT